MSATIVVPFALREYTDGVAELLTSASTVSAALDDLAARHPALRRHLFDERGGLRGFVRIYLNEDIVVDAELSAPLVGGDTMMIVPSIAGGDDTTTLAATRAEFSNEEVSRYARHIALPDVGWEGQRRLKHARVLIVGAGGLGSPLGLYLAAAGVGTIGLVDFDDVDLSNLQRQVLYTTDDVGRPKVDVAADRLRAINPHVVVHRHRLRLTADNALAILRDYDVIVDGTDNFPTRYLVNDACVLLDKPYVYGSIFRFEGQVSVFPGRAGPCYRCLFREPPPPGMVPSCAEGGVLGVLPGIIGSMQALETIKLILGHEGTLTGRLALFDALAFRWRELTLRRNPACPACGDEPTVTALIDYDEFCGVRNSDMSEEQTADEYSPEQLRQRIETGEPLVLIDVREPYEWNISNLEPQGARLIPLGDLPDALDDLDPDAETVVYCRSGSRSASVQQHMRARGFKRVLNLRGGINAWAESIDPDMATY